MRSLRAAGFDNPVKRCCDGDEVLEYLNLFREGGGRDGSEPCPGIILLDLNLPGTDGREVLTEIKSDPRLKLIPVVVLSTSTDPRDVRACYMLGANSYIPKPKTLPDFEKAMKQVKDYWFDVVMTPEFGEYP